MLTQKCYNFTFCSVDFLFLYALNYWTICRTFKGNRRDSRLQLVSNTNFCFLTLTQQDAFNKEANKDTQLGRVCCYA